MHLRETCYYDSLVQLMYQYMPELIFLVTYTSEIYKKIKTNSYTVNINLQNKSNIYGSIRCFFEFNGNVYFILRQFLIEHVNIIYHRDTMMKVKHILLMKEVYDEHKLIIVNSNDVNFTYKIVKIEHFICKRPNVLIKVL